MYENYEKFLNNLNLKLEKFFEEQKPYVCCKPGCDKCCSLGEYPLSRFEFEYLMKGFESLDSKNKKIVAFQIKKLRSIYERKKGKTNEPFEHACPFLVNGLCSVYSHRPLICRTFGLIKSVKTLDGQPVAILPDCLHHGLNYSKVFDFDNNCFDMNKIDKLCTKSQPEAYDISLPVLFEQYEDKSVNFNDRKNLAEFLSELKL